MFKVRELFNHFSNKKLQKLSAYHIEQQASHRFKKKEKLSCITK